MSADAGRDRDWERIDCPVCAGTRFEPLFETAGEPLVRCSGCRLLLINPRPPLERVMAGYGGDYGALYRDKVDSKLRRCRRWVARIRRRVSGGRWLDVGCSAGFVLKAAEEAGFEPFGIDLDREALRFAGERFGLRQLTAGSIETQSWPDGHFSVISAYDVIEHVPDLNAFVETLARLLARDGLLDIRTPDAGHPRVPRDLASWREIKPSEHLYYFDRETLHRLLDKHGLRIVRRRRSLKPALQIYSVHA